MCKIITAIFQLLILLIPCMLEAQRGNSGSARPNIIILFADDLGWADVGYQGMKPSGFHETPNIDRLASGGMIFDRFYPSAANCAPSRACLITGMYTPRHHVYLPQGFSRGVDITKMRWKVPTHGFDSTFNTFQVNINHVAPEWISLAEMLREGGYVTARLGKWHIGDDNQGFDLLSADGTPGHITNLNGNERRYYNDTLVAERLTDLAVDFIYNNRDRPFFLYLAHWEPHNPVVAPGHRVEYYRNKFNRLGNTECDPVYAANVEQLDVSTGRIMAILEALNLEENTMVIFTSDNGGVSNIPSNYPLRASKGTFYEGGIRTPCIIKWPAVVEPGSRTDFPANGVDFMPTFAEMASLPVPESQPVDGVSLLPVLRGEQMNIDRSMFFHFPLYLDRRAVPCTVIMRGDWKMIYYYEYDRYELFNLREDISEQHDLSGKRPGIAGKLLDELNAWTKKVNAPIPGVPNELYQDVE
jgi:arylsulfatase A-like enzyme